MNGNTILTKKGYKINNNYNKMKYQVALAELKKFFSCHILNITTKNKGNTTHHVDTQ